MKKIYFYIGLLLLLVPLKVSASSMSIGISCGDGNVGDSITCVVRGTPDNGATAAQGTISINGGSAEYVSANTGSLNGNVSSSSFNLYGSTQTSTFNLFTITFKAKSAGNTTVNVNLTYISDGEFADVYLSNSAFATIHVNDPQQQQTQPQQNQTQPQQQTQPANNNANTTTQTTKQETKVTTKQETKQEETKKEEVKEEPKKEEKIVAKEKLKIDKFYVVGYDIAFDSEKLDYTIDIKDDVKDIYIVVEGTNLEVEGDKEINIEGKNRVVVRIKSGNTTEEYTIKLNRVSETIETKTDMDPIFIGTTGLFALTTIGCIGYIVYLKKKGKKIKNETK